MFVFPPGSLESFAHRNRGRCESLLVSHGRLFADFSVFARVCRLWESSTPLFCPPYPPLGGEFAFVAFGVAVAQKVLPAPVTSILYLVVALSMALIPYLAAMGGQLGAMLEKSDTKALQPKEEETKVCVHHRGGGRKCVNICGRGGRSNDEQGGACCCDQR